MELIPCPKEYEEKLSEHLRVRKKEVHNQIGCFNRMLKRVGAAIAPHTNKEFVQQTAEQRIEQAVLRADEIEYRRRGNLRPNGNLLDREADVAAFSQYRTCRVQDALDPLGTVRSHMITRNKRCEKDPKEEYLLW